MASAAIVVAPTAEADNAEDKHENSGDSRQEEGQAEVRCAKRARTDDSRDAATTAATAAAEEQHSNKRQHGHHGHLRTRHAVDEPEEQGEQADAGGARGSQQNEAAAANTEQQHIRGESKPTKVRFA